MENLNIMQRSLDLSYYLVAVRKFYLNLHVQPVLWRIFTQSTVRNDELWMVLMVSPSCVGA